MFIWQPQPSSLLEGFLLESMDKTQLQEIAQIMATASGASKVILFGSRARGDFDSSSDWDFLLVMPKGIWMQSFETEMDLVRKTHQALLDAGFDFSLDILLISEQGFEVGTTVLARVVWKEGITLVETSVTA